MYIDTGWKRPRDEHRAKPDECGQEERGKITSADRPDALETPEVPASQEREREGESSSVYRSARLC